MEGGKDFVMSLIQQLQQASVPLAAVWLQVRPSRPIVHSERSLLHHVRDLPLALEKRDLPLAREKGCKLVAVRERSVSALQRGSLALCFVIATV